MAKKFLLVGNINTKNVKVIRDSKMTQIIWSEND